MIEAQLVQLLSKVLGPGRKVGERQYNFLCPVCKHHNRKLSIQVVPKTGNNHPWRCFHCETVNHMSGKSIKSLLFKINCPRQIADEIYSLLELKRGSAVDTSVKTLHLPAEFVKLYGFNPKNDYEFAVYNDVLKYLIYERKLNLYDILKYNIGMCITGEYANRVVIPSYDSNNSLNFFVTRSINPNSKMPHKNPDYDKTLAVPFENTINWNEPVILVEGAYDAISVKRNALPLFGKTITEGILTKLLSSDVEKIYVCLDKDARRGALIHCELLMKYGKEVYFVDIKDKDPNKMGFEKITQILQNTYPLTFTELLKLKLEV